MRIREPREPHVFFLYVWALFFGGLPTVMLVIGLAGSRVASPGNGEPSSVGATDPILEGPWFVLFLFPLIAGVVMFFTVRREFRSGFRFDAEGLHGAHDQEREHIPWERIERLAWVHAGPTTGIEVNDRPLPSGPALYAVLHGGGSVRVMQRCVSTETHRASMDRQLAEAVDRGLVPVPLRPLAEGVESGDGLPSTTPWDRVGWQPLGDHARWRPADPYGPPPSTGAAQPPAGPPADDAPHWPSA